MSGHQDCEPGACGMCDTARENLRPDPRVLLIEARITLKGLAEDASAMVDRIDRFLADPSPRPEAAGELVRWSGFLRKVSEGTQAGIPGGKRP